MRAARDPAGDGRVLAAGARCGHADDFAARSPSVGYKPVLMARRRTSPFGIQLRGQLRVLGVGDGPLGHLLRSLQMVQLAHAGKRETLWGRQIERRHLGLQILLHPLQAVPEDRIGHTVAIVQVPREVPQHVVLGDAVRTDEDDRFGRVHLPLFDVSDKMSQRIVVLRPQRIGKAQGFKGDVPRIMLEADQGPVDPGGLLPFTRCGLLLRRCWSRRRNFRRRHVPKKAWGGCVGQPRRRVGAGRRRNKLRLQQPGCWGASWGM